MSDFEGKTRLYRFNPAYPLLEELEQLLKKTYTLLPLHDKKHYSLLEKQNRTLRLSENRQVLFKFWERMAKVTKLTFHARSKSNEEGGWNGRGKGEVTVTHEGETVLLFHEKGTWQGKEGKETNFSNVFRWTFDRSSTTISLEHLRRGLQHPVFLFHLSPSSHDSLSSIDSHLCEGDAYFGKIICDEQCLRLHWRVIGPKKNEEIDYYYL